MSEYKKPYLILMNACEDALRAMEKGETERARDLLIEGQRRAEEAFITYTES